MRTIMEHREDDLLEEDETLLQLNSSMETLSVPLAERTVCCVNWTATSAIFSTSPGILVALLLQQVGLEDKPTVNADDAPHQSVNVSLPGKKESEHDISCEHVSESQKLRQF